MESRPHNPLSDTSRQFTRTLIEAQVSKSVGSLLKLPSTFQGNFKFCAYSLGYTFIVLGSSCSTTSMQVQIQLEHNTLLRAQRVLTPTTKSLMPVGVRDEEPYDRCKRYYSGTTETEEAPWGYILRLQISTAIMTCFCFAPDGFA